MERPNPTRFEVSARVEDESIHAGFDDSAFLHERTQAAGVRVVLERGGQSSAWQLVGHGETDADGRWAPDRRVEDVRGD